jgi:hypothetical protein
MHDDIGDRAGQQERADAAQPWAQDPTRRDRGVHRDALIWPMPVMSMPIRWS